MRNVYEFISFGVGEENYVESQSLNTLSALSMTTQTFGNGVVGRVADVTLDTTLF